jgi:hypothetical protein
LVIEAERPKALAVSPDQSHVYAAIFESGNRTTIIGAKFKNRLFVDNVVGLSNAPSGSQNPAPNSATGFQPPLNPNLPTNQPPPGSGLIVARARMARWLDDHQGDWTEFVSGTNAHLTGRIAGWDLPDRDLAIIDADNFNVSYVSGAMNICMDLAVNPISGTVAMIGTDARNEARFEPNLNGTFAQVHLALIPNAPSGPMVPQIIDPQSAPHLSEPDHSRGGARCNPSGSRGRSFGTRTAPPPTWQASVRAIWSSSMRTVPGDGGAYRIG